MKPSWRLPVYSPVAEDPAWSEHISFVTKTYTSLCCRRAESEAGAEGTEVHSDRVNLALSAAHETVDEGGGRV